MTVLAFILVALGGVFVGSIVTLVVMSALMEAKIADIIDEKDRFDEFQSELSFLPPKVRRGTFPRKPNSA